MSIIRRKFTIEQKLKIVKESLEADVSIESLAQQYKIPPNRIYKWRRKYLHNVEESLRLMDEIKRAEFEREILEKTLGRYFDDTDLPEERS